MISNPRLHNDSERPLGSSFLQFTENIYFNVVSVNEKEMAFLNFKLKIRQWQQRRKP
jgi:hypothetical protein